MGNSKACCIMVIYSWRFWPELLRSIPAFSSRCEDQLLRGTGCLAWLDMDLDGLSVLPLGQAVKSDLCIGTRCVYMVAKAFELLGISHEFLCIAHGLDPQVEMNAFGFLTYWVDILFLTSHQLVFMSRRGILKTCLVTNHISVPSRNAVGLYCLTLLGPTQVCWALVSVVAPQTH